MDITMKRFIVVVLCAAVCLSGCSSSSGGSGSLGSDDEIGNAIWGTIIGGAVVIGVAASSIYKHQHRSIQRYPPGLNLVADKRVRAGKTFRVRAIVADENRKVVNGAFDQSTVAWTLQSTAPDAPILEPVGRPSMSGGVAADFRVETPGTYRATFKAWPKGSDTATAAPEREGTAEIAIQ